MSKSPRAFGKLQILMKGITLRRVKTDIVDGKPILVLPPKTDEIRYLVMNEKERQLYDKVHKAGKAMFESLKASGTVMKNYVNILRAILMMRQACLHPSLVKYQEAHPVVEEDDIVDLGAPMSVERAESVFKVLSQTDQDLCIFCANTVEIPGAMITPCSHLYLLFLILGSAKLAYNLYFLHHLLPGRAVPTLEIIRHQFHVHRVIFP
jgi:SWI/SNF-related matrix-associated actin-dependent regulator of chromatin subfamily A3